MATKSKDTEVTFKRLGAVGGAKKTADGHVKAMDKSSQLVVHWRVLRRKTRRYFFKVLQNYRSSFKTVHFYFVWKRLKNIRKRINFISPQYCNQVWMAANPGPINTLTPSDLGE